MTPVLMKKNLGFSGRQALLRGRPRWGVKEYHHNLRRNTLYLLRTRRKVCVDDLYFVRVYALILVAARQYGTKQINLATPRSESRADVDAIDLGWREPEKRKSQKKKKVVGASDSTDRPEKREAAKVGFPCTLLIDIYIQRNRYIEHVY